MDQIVKEEVAKTIKKCIKYGDFTLKSGKKSNYYIDLRSLFSNPTSMKQIAWLLRAKIDSSHRGLICGLPYAAIPHACFVSACYDIPMIMLRAEEKYHGTKKMIEGEYKKGDNLILIDDILTMGTSVIDSLPFFNEFKIDKVIVILDREEGGREKLEKMGIKVESIFKISELESTR